MTNAINRSINNYQIPMDNMEGRYQAGAHAMLVKSAAEANMNMVSERPALCYSCMLLA